MLHKYTGQYTLNAWVHRGLVAFSSLHLLSFCMELCVLPEASMDGRAAWLFKELYSPNPIANSRLT